LYLSCCQQSADVRGRSALEISVQHMHVENDQLRKGLATLLASRPDAAASSSLTDPTIDPILSTPAPQNGTGIDYAYLSRLQTELASSKSTLLDKELELARLKGVEVNGDDLDDLRHLILSHHAKLTTLDAEAKSLESTVNHLRSERDELAKQGAVIRRELDMRRVLSGIEGPEAEVGVNQAPGEDAALLDVSGWMEAAAKNWDQVSRSQVGID